MSVTLPKLYKAKFTGFTPLFDSTIEIEIKNNLLILLGGNGLGKTTLLQAIIFGIGGSLDQKIEVESNMRWTKKYFTDRLADADNAFIEIEFFLGEDLIKLKRGFQTERILEFYLNHDLYSSGKTDAEELFESYIIRTAKFDSLNSFRFLIHKLCYLSEKRENLIWNKEDQTRVLMMIFSDSIAESKFRDRKDQLQKLDSKIRHLQVDINKITEQLSKSFKQNKKSKKSDTEKLESLSTEEEVNKLKAEYLALIENRIESQKKARGLKAELSTLNSEIEDIQEQITQSEQNYIYDQIEGFESTESKLAIHKLLHNKLCPACGNINEELFRKALEYIHSKSCPLCGMNESVQVSELAPGLEADLTEKIQAKIERESHLLDLEVNILDYTDSENEIQLKLRTYMLEIPSVIYVKANTKKEQNAKELKRILTSLVSQQNERRLEFEKLKEMLDRDYERFRKKNNARLDSLADLYKSYATEFLGIPCSLKPIDQDNTFLDLKLFVPEFNGIVRNTPDSCSEAQRFFLDIAFRMSLIELSCQLTNSSATFICETPESALDISYRNNVADMFQIFMKNNSLILSNNIQPEGITETLLLHLAKTKRKNSIFNLLKLGKLSKVQADNIEVFESLITKFLTQ